MGEVLYDVMVYPYHFKSKKEAQQKIGVVKNNILRYPKQLTIEDVAKTCVSGQPISFCHAESTCNITSLIVLTTWNIPKPLSMLRSKDFHLLLHIRPGATQKTTINSEWSL